MTDQLSKIGSESSGRALTLRDVSEASGVSEMTVSRVLRNSGDVAPATREKVLKAAKALGYVPNRIAGALASSRVNLVAVIIPSLSNMVFPEVLNGISDGLEESGLQPVFGMSQYRQEREEEVLYEMLSWRPSGVIIAGLEHSDASRMMLRNASVPIVEIMDTDGDPIDAMVGISHRRAGREMAQAILRAGYRRICFIGTKLPLDHRARKRFEGFTEALAKSGVEMLDHEFYSGGSSLAKGRELTSELLSRQPDLDFIYASNDVIAAGGMFELMARGIKIPDQIGIAGFNGVELLEGLPMQLATMDARRFEIGQKAAKIITARYSGKQFQDRIELEAKLTNGNTIRH